MAATRLDPLVRLREREEEQARLALARAIEHSRVARERLLAAEEAARSEDQSAGPAYDWVVRELAHARAADEAERAKEALAGALAAEGVAREACAAAWKRLEAVRRVAEARRAADRAEEERRERKLFDEIGARRAGARRR